MTNKLAKTLRTSMAPSRENFLFPLQQQFDKFFDDFFSADLSGIKASAGYPKMNICERDESLLIQIAATGMKAEDFSIDVDERNCLNIEGKTSSVYQTESPSVNWHLRELRSSVFSRSVQLPDTVKGDPHATLKDGVLTLEWKLKKKEELSPVKKKVQIHSE